MAKYRVILEAEFETNRSLKELDEQFILCLKGTDACFPIRGVNYKEFELEELDYKEVDIEDLG